MRSPAALCNSLLIAAYFGILYGGSVAIGTDISFSILKLYPVNFQQPARFWLSTGITATLHLAFLPSFEWSFCQDAFRLPQSMWKMSLHTFYLLAILYPLMIHLGTETFLLTKSDEFITRLVFSVPTATVFTYIMESIGMFNIIRVIYLTDVGIVN